MLTMHTPSVSIADVPFLAFLAVVVTLYGVRNRMNSVIFAKDGLKYGLSRQRDMMNHYCRLAGRDANYRFYRIALVAAPVSFGLWVLLSSLSQN